MATIDFGALLQQAILSVNPRIDVSDTSQFSELVVRPLRAYMAQVETLINREDVVRDIRRFADMSDQELEALAANFFVTRKTGTFALGRVLVYYINPQDVTLPIGQQFFSTTGAAFISTTQISLKSAQLSAAYDPVQNAYPVEITGVRSLGTGPVYEVGAGEISSMANQTANVALVTNPESFTTSVPGETKAQLAARVIQGASQRNLCSADSTRAFLNDDGRVRATSVIGAGAPEMTRDIIYGFHAKGTQDIYVYGASPLVPYIVEQPVSVPGLPVFAFLGYDLSGTVAGGVYPPYNADRSGPVVFIQKVEYGTGTGGAFIPTGVMRQGQDYTCAHLPLGTDSNKNSVQENWQLIIITRPPATATRIRVTALRDPLIASLQNSLAVSGARAPAQFALVKSFFTVLTDITVALKPAVGASTDPATYVTAITNLFLNNPIASQLDQSNVVNALVQAGAERVELPFSTTVRVFYPDLTEGNATFRGPINLDTLANGQASTRTMAIRPGTIVANLTS